MADSAINSHDPVASWDWARNFLTQAASGGESGALGTGAKHRWMSLNDLRSLLVELDNVVNDLTTTLPGKVLDARQAKVLSDAILLRELIANKVSAFQATPDDEHYPTEKLVKDALDLLTSRIDNILEGQDLDPNKDVEVLDARTSATTGMVYPTIGQRMDALDVRSAKIFGLDWNNSTDAYTRTDDAVGMTTSAPNGVSKIVSDFDDYYPWKGIKQVKVDGDKRILAYLGDALYDTVDGEYMTLVPQFWYQDYIDGTIRKVRIADMPLAGYKPAWLDKDGNPVQYRLIGRTPAGYDTELRSKPDMGVEVNRTYTSFITTAYAKGNGEWWLDDSATRHKLGLLMAVEAGDWDVKAKYGNGIQSGMPYGSGAAYLAVAATTSANTVTIPDTPTNFYVGMVVQIGTAYTNNSIAKDRKITDVTNNLDGTQTITVDGAPFNTAIGTSIATWGQPVPSEQIDALDGGSGYILQFGSSARSHVSYRGIWDLWGNVWSFTYGFARYDGRYYVCFDQSKYNVSDPRSNAGWFDTGKSVYIENGYQYTREPFVTDHGSVDFPTATGGGAGSATFYAAYLYYFNSTYSGVRILLSGGSWSYGGSVSLFCCDGSGAPGSSIRLIGSRLIA
ncbi:MAG: hypothetical protein VB025_07565 [Sphaerochaeta sp.]|nr:hypothetical protein [Sphaerochaeta sp.]